MHRLRRSIHDIKTLKKNNTSTYQEGAEFLRLEASDDEQAKLKYGTERWTRQSSQQAAERLYAQLAEIDGYLRSAQSSDELVQNKLQECEKLLRILEGTDRELEEYVPRSRTAVISPRVEREVSQLSTILNEIKQIENRRRRKAETLREKGKADDISMI